MITVNTNGQALSQAFVDALTDPALRYDAKLLMNGVELNGLIDSVTITEGSCGDEGAFSVGSVVGSTMVAVVADLRDIVKGQEIEVHIGVMTDAEAKTYEYVRMGYFNVSACPRNANKTTITAYGRTVTKTACAFTPPATKTIANIVANIKSDIQAAYGLNVPITVSGVPTTLAVGGSLEGLTCYQVLQILASAVGGYATDTPDGGIIIKKLDPTVSLSTNTDRMVTLPVVEENDFEITGVTCSVSEEVEVEVDKAFPSSNLQRYGAARGETYTDSVTVTLAQGYRTGGEEFFYAGSATVNILDIETQEWTPTDEEFTAIFSWGTSSEEVVFEYDDGDVNVAVKLVYNATASTMAIVLNGTVSNEYYAQWGAACGSARYSSEVQPAVSYTYGTPVTLTVENPYMTQELFNAGLKTFVGYEYRPGMASLTYGDPRLEGTDVVEITDINGDVYSLPCHSLVHKYTGGLTSTITAAVATFEENDISTALPITSSIADVASSALAAKVSADAAAVSAESANQSAISASASAAGASESAQYAAAQAVAADQEAKRAKTAADNAQASAENASEYAARALGNLSTVQNVTETLNWITAHGTMTLTSDTALDPTHVYFIQDNNGDYVVGNVHYSIVIEPKLADISTYYELSIDESLNNYVATHLAVDSEGLWIIPDAGGNKVLIATGQGSTYTSAGTYIVGPSAVLASFTADGITLGEVATGNYAVIDDDNFDIKNGTTDIAHFGYGETYAPSGLTDYPFYTLGTRRTTIEPFDSTKSYMWGSMCVYNGRIYVCVSEKTTAGAWNWNDWKFYIGGYSHARGLYVVSCGYCSVADGYSARALGNASHAVGDETKAIGESSHAEGHETYAIGKASHAEGQTTRARGIASHAEGSSAFAEGDYSHAQNYRTIAAKDYQTVIGKYNIEDTEIDESKQKAFIIGNGSYDGTHVINSNAFSVDWGGNVEASGDIEDGSGNVLRDKADSSDLADYLPLTGGTLTGELNGTNVKMSGNITSKTAKLDISNYTTSGNVDKTIYDALNSLGWLSDCTES